MKGRRTQAEVVFPAPRGQIYERHKTPVSLPRSKADTENGFNQIVDLAFEMNPSGIRKYSKKEIKI